MLMQDHSSLQLSVIIPTLNRGAVFFSTVKQVVQQTVVRFEVIVVDQSDPAAAAENAAFCESLNKPLLRYFHLQVKSLPNARNFGMMRASAPVILFLDDDVILLNDYFMQAHLSAFDNPEVGGATGRSVERTVSVNARRTACHVSLGGRTIFNLMGTFEQSIGGCKGSNMSFRKTVLETVRGFDRQTELLEDADFSLRVIKAGWKLMFLPDAELFHLSVPTGGVRGNEVSAERRRFRSTAYFIFKHRGWIGFIPFICIFSLIAVTRAWRIKSPRIASTLLSEIYIGYKMWKAGPQEALEDAH